MRKFLNVVEKIITAIIMIFAIFVTAFTVISVNTVGKNDSDFFGYKPYIVLSDSMQDTFAVGDLSVSKKVDPKTLEVGDIITFKSIDPVNYDQIVTHKIRKITTYEGEPAFITYGTTTGSDDSYPVPFDKVVGEYQFRLPQMGYFFEFLKSTAGYFTLIFVPFFILIVLQAINFFKLLKKYKREQQAEIDEQKAKAEAQRLEAQKMKDELKKLKEQLKKENSKNEVPSIDSDSSPRGDN